MSVNSYPNFEEYYIFITFTIKEIIKMVTVIMANPISISAEIVMIR
jgi:hypothetical protein